jgi:2-succinyl-5-enolpyruvyl-6-hydroxy-3-cyclohexene-1-carboxylate synthase
MGDDRSGTRHNGGVLDSTSEVSVTAAATFCATLVDEWARRGLTEAFVSPGSRHTPLLLALDDRPEFRLHIFHDERSTSFAALGYAQVSGLPGIVLCTSGTAAAHFHAAVIEADLSAVPMIICTADRPPEAWDRGSPQTINQTKLYGDAVRSFVEPGPAQDDGAEHWRPLAANLLSGALGHNGDRPGPVHANLSFRDPLVGKPGQLPATIAVDPPTTGDISDQEIADVCRLMAGKSGVIIAGQGVSHPEALHSLARFVGWPIVADHQSGSRTATTINHADALLRVPDLAADLRPQVVLRFGEALSSKALSQWCQAAADAGTLVIGLHQPGRLIDPEDVCTLTVPEAGAASGIEAALAAHQPSAPPTGSPLAERWLQANTGAGEAITAALATDTKSEISVTLRALHAAGPNGVVVAASSMAIRHLEWFDTNPPLGTRVLSNRGANGIDGTMATAIGVALTGVPTVCIVGDLAFLHDATSLTALAQRAIDLTIVVVDNDGGGIFSFLPQAKQLEPSQFETLFGTPHGTDLSALAQAHELCVGSADDLKPEGIKVVVAQTVRPHDVDNIATIVTAVASALEG